MQSITTQSTPSTPSILRSTFTELNTNIVNSTPQEIYNISIRNHSNKLRNGNSRRRKNSIKHGRTRIRNQNSHSNSTQRADIRKHKRKTLFRKRRRNRRNRKIEEINQSVHLDKRRKSKNKPEEIYNINNKADIPLREPMSDHHQMNRTNSEIFTVITTTHPISITELLLMPIGEPRDVKISSSNSKKESNSLINLSTENNNNVENIIMSELNMNTQIETISVNAFSDNIDIILTTPVSTLKSRKNVGVFSNITNHTTSSPNIGDAISGISQLTNHHSSLNSNNIIDLTENDIDTGPSRRSKSDSHNRRKSHKRKRGRSGSGSSRHSNTFGGSSFESLPDYLRHRDRRQLTGGGGIIQAPLLSACKPGAKRDYNYKCRPKFIPQERSRRASDSAEKTVASPVPPRIKCPEVRKTSIIGSSHELVYLFKVAKELVGLSFAI